MMWTSHRISVDCEIEGQNCRAKATQIRKAVREALRMEGIAVPCEINVLLTDDAGIREINQAQRAIDAATDVLSFPMWELMPGQAPQPDWADPGTGLLALGDMVLSLERVDAQAKEYGHSRARELCYLVVHSVLHLLGYDHLDEGAQKLAMRAREEAILAQLNIKRSDKEPT